MPPRIVRNEEAAANYGWWVTGLRREATRKAYDRHRVRRRVGRAPPGRTEQKTGTARPECAVRRAAVGAPSHRKQNPLHGQVKEAAAPVLDCISSWVAAGLQRPQVELMLRSALLLAGLILALCALGMVGSS